MKATNSVDASKTALSVALREALSAALSAALQVALPSTIPQFGIVFSLNFAIAGSWLVMMGFLVLKSYGMRSSSNLARDMLVLKCSPSARVPLYISAFSELDKMHFAFSY